MVDDDCATIGERLHRMADTGGHDGHEPRTDDLRDAVDRHLKLSLDNFVDFFLRMEMLVNGRAAHEIIVREGHVRRVEIASMPTGQALDDAQFANVDDGHKNFSFSSAHRSTAGRFLRRIVPALKLSE